MNKWYRKKRREELSKKSKARIWKSGNDIMTTDKPAGFLFIDIVAGTYAMGFIKDTNEV
jgi:uncharacterized protein (DUF2141 family)